MFKKKNKIYIKDWMALKPYEKQSKTDLYYLNLCNEVKKALSKNPSFFVLKGYLDEGEISELCCFLVSYFEDIVSETNIWHAFVSKHFELYGKKLPFFDMEEYFEGEINEQDVRFLVWYFVNVADTDRYLGPINDFIEKGADSVMEVFEREYEYAPENDSLKPYYTLSAYADYYEVRYFLQTLFLGTYLFMPDTHIRYSDMMMEILSQPKEEDDQEMMESYLEDARDRFILCSCAKLLGCRANEWAAAVLGKQHPLHNAVQTLSQKAQGWFFYQGQDTEKIYLRHIASGKNFNMTQKSFEVEDKLKEGSMIYLGMVAWRGDWWFSGISVISGYSADLVATEKKSLSSKKDLNFLEDKERINEIMEQQEKVFLNYNNGSRIAFLKGEEANEFLNGYYEYYNKSLNLSKKERRANEKRAERKGSFNCQTDNDLDFDGEIENVTVYFNPKSGVEFYLNLAGAFPTPENPFYKEREKDQDFMELLADEGCSTEIVKFCVDNFRDQYDFFQRGFDYSKDEFDFLLRFFKNDSYHTEPNITLT